MAGILKEIHNEELHDLYSSLDVIGIMESRWVCWLEYVARAGLMKDESGVILGKPRGKRQLERPRHKWEHSIKMDLKERG
jgi:hypothetical protein